MIDLMKDLMKRTYVINGQEVKLTGRRAKLNWKLSVRSPPRREASTDFYQYEIEYLKEEDSEITTQQKKMWVSIDALYVVENTTQEKQ